MGWEDKSLVGKPYIHPANTGFTSSHSGWFLLYTTCTGSLSSSGVWEGDASIPTWRHGHHAQVVQCLVHWGRWGLDGWTVLPGLRQETAQVLMYYALYLCVFLLYLCIVYWVGWMAPPGRMDGASWVKAGDSRSLS